MSEARSPLHVALTGDGPTTLVLLHGGAGDSTDLAGLRDVLQPGRRIIAPDQRSHGRSPELGELTYAAMAADTAQLLDELGVTGADLVGWSDGGVIALTIARDRPDLVGRVVAISANVSSAAPAPPAADASTLAWIQQATSDDIALPDGRDEVPGGRDAWPGVVERLKVMWQADPGISLDDLAALARPVLFVAGDHDIVRIEHTVAMFQATPGALLGIVPGAGHQVPQTHADEVARMIAAFLDPVAAPG